MIITVGPKARLTMFMLRFWKLAYGRFKHWEN
jgi:hypothetical protein